MKHPPAIVRYALSHAVPIMKRHPPEDWWKACRDLPPGEIKDEVTAWLRQEKHRIDCWRRLPASIMETKKAGR